MMRGMLSAVLFVLLLPRCGCSEDIIGHPDATDTLSETDERDIAGDEVEETPIPSETWVAYTGPDYPRRYGRTFTETGDGGLAFAGFTEEVDRAVWVVKVNDGEDIEWSRYIQVEAGTGAWVEGIVETADGNLVLIGTVFSGEISRILLLELDGDGHPIRQRTGGEIDENRGLAIVSTRDGEFVVTGMLEGILWSGTPWIASLDEHLDIRWQKRFAGMHIDDIGGALSVTRSGDVLFAGKSQGAGTAWLAKLDVDGDVLWQRVIRDWGAPHAGPGVVELTDGDIALSLPSYGGTVMRFDPSGTLLWQESLGGEWTYAVTHGEDGGIIVAGCEFGLAGTGPDMWLLGLDTDGTMLWQKSVLISPEDTAYEVLRTVDGALVALSGGCCSTGIVKFTADGEFFGDCDMVVDTATSPVPTSYVVEDGAATMESAHLAWTDAVPVELDAPTSIHVECRGP